VRVNSACFKGDSGLGALAEGRRIHSHYRPCSGTVCLPVSIQACLGTQFERNAMIKRCCLRFLLSTEAVDFNLYGICPRRPALDIRTSLPPQNCLSRPVSVSKAKILLPVCGAVYGRAESSVQAVTCPGAERFSSWPVAWY